MVTALLVELLRGQRAIGLHMHQRGWRRELASDILKVARPASLNPLMNVATILGLTALVGQFGTQALAGYGIGTRIEFVMLPVIFAFGTALTTIVGTNIGAGNYDRAELAGRYGMTSAALICGTVGGFLALFPNLWIPIFTDDAGTFEVARSYIPHCRTGLCLSRYWIGAVFCITRRGHYDMADTRANIALRHFSRRRFFPRQLFGLWPQCGFHRDRHRFGPLCRNCFNRRFQRRVATQIIALRPSAFGSPAL